MLQKTLANVLQIALFAALVGLLAPVPAYSQQCAGRPCWQVDLEWSMGNDGPVESNIRAEWQTLGILGPCIHGRGRITAMALAIDAAKHGFDERAYRIARSTQMHNPSAIQHFPGNPFEVAEWLRHH